MEVGCWIHLCQKLAQPSEETLLYSETNTFRGTDNFLTREISTTEQNYWGISTNKNVLSSIESRLLGDETRWVLLSKAPVLLYYFFVWNTPPGKRVLHVVMYILKKKKCKERQAAHRSLKLVWNLWKPSTYWYCPIEEYSFRDFTIEKLNDDFISIRGPWLCQYKYT